MNPATAGSAADYQVFSTVVKKVKKSIKTTQRPVAVSVSYDAAINEVTIKVGSTKPFAKGGQIVISGVTSAAGANLSASDTTLMILNDVKRITVG
jgi:hypothetical protein